MKQNADSRHPFLVALGERVRALRAEHSLTRKQLAVIAKVSERHLANLEGGTGNVSVLILVDLAKAFDISVVQLLGGEQELAPRVRLNTVPSLQAAATASAPSRIALIGLRGAGKSTLGVALAKALGYRFIETSREIESLAGSSLAEIYNLYGEAGYRRFERQAIKDICALKEPVVIATPGGIVSNADTFELLLRQCRVVWLQAKPLDHLSRVRAQGDNRPMAATRTTQRAAIDDLKLILQTREPEYGRANITFDTSGYDVATCERELLKLLQSA
jgi:XRE family transcriptional regulator, aerobic/anaerobic benzoate catabolism transcriptional regulator